MRIGIASKPLKTGPWTSNTDMLISIRRMEDMVKYLDSLGVDMYRLTSQIVPRIRPDPEQSDTFDVRQVYQNSNAIRQLGAYYIKHDIRTCMHTTYYCVPNSTNDETVDESRKEFEIFSHICDALGNDSFLEFTPGIVRSGESRAEAFARTIDFFDSLDDNVIKNLVVENTGADRYLGTINECIELVERYGIRMDIDFVHAVNNPLELKEHGSVQKALQIGLAASGNSWDGRGVPVSHWGYLTLRKDFPADKIDTELFFKIMSHIPFDIDVIVETNRREFDVVDIKRFLQSSDTII